MGKVRVRFAPSPSGSIHLGNARIALLNYLFALKEGGEFILRVDDTDFKTTDVSNIPKIMVDLKRLGIIIQTEPKYQSQHLERYRKIADKLLTDGWAYPCYCSAEMLEQENRLAIHAKQAPRYSGRCKRLSPAEIKAKANQPAAIRFNVEKAKTATVRFNDEILGEIEIPVEGFGDFIIVRNSGVASYNFASAIDDMDLSISHIIRGSDHLSNTARQCLVWQALKTTPPKLAHVSLLGGAQGAPLSKREGDSSVSSYLERGFLAEALVHYLVSIGTTGFTQEVFKDLSALAQHFVWPKSSGVAHFELAKLEFFNRLYLHALPAKTLANRWHDLGIKLQAKEPEIVGYLELFKGNFTTLRELEKVDTVLFGRKKFDYKNYATLLSEYLDKSQFQKMIDLLSIHLTNGKLAKESDWHQVVEELLSELKLPKKNIYMGLRLLLTGETHGPELHRILAWLGKPWLSAHLVIS